MIYSVNNSEEAFIESILHQDAIIFVSANEQALNEANVTLPFLSNKKRYVVVHLFSNGTDGSEISHAPRIKLITSDNKNYNFYITTLGKAVIKFNKNEKARNPDEAAYQRMCEAIGTLACREIYAFFYGEIDDKVVETAIELKYNDYLSRSGHERKMLEANLRKDLELHPIVRKDKM